jgi:uncharacterized YccA/Bax inhibitor family protein
MALASFAVVAHSRVPGVVTVALFLTCGILAAMLVGYRLGWLPDFSDWSVGIAAFFITILAVYAGIFLLRMSGMDLPFPKQTTVVYWAVVVGFMVYLSYQLANSFRFIDYAIEMGAPKWMEWRAAFGLMVALLAIYYEVLTLLVNLSRRRR